MFPLPNGDTPMKFVTTTEETLVHRVNNIFSLPTYQTSEFMQNTEIQREGFLGVDFKNTFSFLISENPLESESECPASAIS